MSWDAMKKAGAGLLMRHGPAALRTVIDQVSAARPREVIVRGMPDAIGLLDGSRACGWGTHWGTTAWP
jgi:hypothetical protein